jgi:TfoX/Sxy family transcriptional regulator of competence genes
MAYNEELAERVLDILRDQPAMEAKKMFGGVGYLVHGNMACGVNEDMLVVRVGPEAYEQRMEQPNTRPFDITGRPMKGWLMVEPAGFSNQSDLESWVKTGLDFALTLPAK